MVFASGIEATSTTSQYETNSHPTAAWNFTLSQEDLAERLVNSHVDDSLRIQNNVIQFTNQYIASSFEKILQELPWVRKLYEEGSDIETSEKMLPYFLEFNNLLHSGDFETFDTILKELRTEDLSSEMLISIVRLTYSARENLPSWNSALESVRTEIVSRKIDSKSALVGLI